MNRSENWKGEGLQILDETSGFRSRTITSCSGKLLENVSFQNSVDFRSLFGHPFLEGFGDGFRGFWIDSFLDTFWRLLG